MIYKSFYILFSGLFWSGFKYAYMWVNKAYIWMWPACLLARSKGPAAPGGFLLLIPVSTLSRGSHHSDASLHILILPVLALYKICIMQDVVFLDWLLPHNINILFCIKIQAYKIRLNHLSLTPNILTAQLWKLRPKAMSAFTWSVSSKARQSAWKNKSKKPTTNHDNVLFGKRGRGPWIPCIHII